jgi:hypothetical protein
MALAPRHHLRAAEMWAAIPVSALASKVGRKLSQVNGSVSS